MRKWNTVCLFDLLWPRVCACLSKHRTRQKKCLTSGKDVNPGGAHYSIKLLSKPVKWRTCRSPPTAHWFARLFAKFLQTKSGRKIVERTWWNCTTRKLNQWLWIKWNGHKMWGKPSLECWKKNVWFTFAYSKDLRVLNLFIKIRGLKLQKQLNKFHFIKPVFWILAIKICEFRGKLTLAWISLDVCVFPRRICVFCFT